MKKKPILSFYMNDHYIQEWATREEGSYEDNNRPENHAHAILNRCGKNRLAVYSVDELNTLISSGEYCCTWNNGGEFSDKADAAIAVAVKKLNAFQIPA